MTEYAPITTEQKKKILGLNAAKMCRASRYPRKACALPAADETATGPRGADGPLPPRPRECLMSLATGTTAEGRRPVRGGARHPRRPRQLDEPVTGLGFVRSVPGARRKREVVHLRLPTSFCSPNFAYLMASDARTL